ncbi:MULTISPECIES: diaminobutyrate acetyltransferase [unclassified Paenibacillus]|uniref:diaminobutyrate acetyltransferase n=1 Tax=unclassified Paenibacillus TaxID=185978 RepID=UPI001AE4E83C|nr:MULTISPECIES: diaminobutyrate acetyltransferase [unclassified Paenibacillus]MBP1157236.1 L-2,4-diaminobutyric acid acetyltransferase [Paenibacillus sp. PvP091]MBP1172025.1 L-2,4-diaminobutyric acid acetyltransferase [Paenibacillus sp. PvR098]MBP2438406.1 L-2,4-diaminobutyric acid acetyltransferase [Paenibacillus sp. PvP052]
MPQTGASIIRYRKPDKEDGGKVWELIRSAGTLDLNSAYCYIMLCDYFRDTCIVAEQDGKLAGFVSAFRPPGHEDTLFVWQIAVASEHRGRGIGKALLQELLAGCGDHAIRFVEATISPSNQASRSLFGSIAKLYGSVCKMEEGYPAEIFPGGGSHEEECIYRIGPLQIK